MNTTGTKPRKLAGAHSDYTLRLSDEDRRALVQIAENRGWSLAEAFRRAVALFLSVNSDIIQGQNGNHHAAD